MALIFKADQEMTAPPQDAPMLPDTTSGLALDYAFDALRSTVANGAPITSAASTGNVSIALDKTTTGATKPALIHSGPGGHAALSFTGTNLIATGTGDATPVLFSGGQELTVALVAKINTTSETVRIVGIDHNPSQANYRYIKPLAGGGVASVSARDGGAASSLSSTTNVQGKWSVIIVSQSVANSFIKVNAEAPVSGSHVLGSMHGLRLGATGTTAPAAASFFVGEIARVQVFSRALSKLEAGIVGNELMATYAIS